MRYFTNLWISMVVQLTNQISINRAPHLITSLSILYSSNYWIVRQIPDQILRHYLTLCFLDLYSWADQSLKYGQVPFFLDKYSWATNRPDPHHQISPSHTRSPHHHVPYQITRSSHLIRVFSGHRPFPSQCPMCMSTNLIVGHIYKRCYNSIAYLVHAEPFRAGLAWSV